MTNEISRDLLGKIVDEVFDGGLEDASVIEDIYRVVKREEGLSPSVVVKALEWEESANGNRWSAPSVLGEYRIYTYSRSGTVELSCGPSIIIAECESIEAAKAAAQADYEQRIRSTLATPDDGRGE
jgi:hypothetical protein